MGAERLKFKEVELSRIEMGLRFTYLSSLPPALHQDRSVMDTLVSTVYSVSTAFEPGLLRDQAKKIDEEYAAKIYKQHVARLATEIRNPRNTISEEMWTSVKKKIAREFHPEIAELLVAKRFDGHPYLYELASSCKQYLTDSHTAKRLTGRRIILPQTIQTPQLVTDQEYGVRETPKVDDLSDEELGDIISQSISDSEMRLRRSRDIDENPLGENITRGIVTLVTDVWRTQKIEDLFSFAKEVDQADNPESRNFEIQIDKDYLRMTRQEGKEPREAVDSLKSRVVGRLTPIRVPQLPPLLRSYPTSAMEKLLNIKKLEKPRFKPPSI